MAMIVVHMCERMCVLREMDERRNYVYDYGLRSIKTYWDVRRTTRRPRENDPSYHSHCRRVDSSSNSVM